MPPRAVPKLGSIRSLPPRPRAIALDITTRPAMGRTLSSLLCNNQGAMKGSLRRYRVTLSLLVKVKGHLPLCRGFDRKHETTGRVHRLLLEPVQMSSSPAGVPPEAGDRVSETIIAEALSIALLARVRTMRVLLETEDGGLVPASDAAVLHGRLEKIEAQLEARRRPPDDQGVDIVYLD
ncbi:hypothetical protein [Phreatobacter stygius]|nr:hypothetical protein [Phreatobacter stygius]